MNKLANKVKKSFIIELKQRTEYNSPKKFQEPIDLFFPLICYYSLKDKSKKE